MNALQTVLSHEHFLALRQTCIGGSDAAAILGLSPYKTAFDVYCQKRGLVEDSGDNEAMRCGRILEPVILDEFERLTNLKTVRGHFARHPEYPHVGANFDGLVLDAAETPIAVVEAKNVGAFNADKFGPSWTDQVPDEYNLQVQHAMFVAGCRKGYLIALLGGNRFRIYELDYRPDIMAAALAEYQKFWEMVQSGNPPEVTGAPSVSETLARLYPLSDKGTTLTAEPADEAMAYELAKVREHLKLLDEQEETLVNKLKARMGATEALVGSFGKITWSNTRDSQKVDYKAICEALKAPEELVTAHTTTVPGTRRFVPYFGKAKK